MGLNGIDSLSEPVSSGHYRNCTFQPMKLQLGRRRKKLYVRFVTHMCLTGVLCLSLPVEEHARLAQPQAGFEEECKKQAWFITQTKEVFNSILFIQQ